MSIYLNEHVKKSVQRKAHLHNRDKMPKMKCMRRLINTEVVLSSPKWNECVFSLSNRRTNLLTMSVNKLFVMDASIVQS